MRRFYSLGSISLTLRNPYPEMSKIIVPDNCRNYLFLRRQFSRKKMKTTVQYLFFTSLSSLNRGFSSLKLFKTYGLSFFSGNQILIMFDRRVCLGHIQKRFYGEAVVMTIKDLTPMRKSFNVPTRNHFFDLLFSELLNSTSTSTESKKIASYARSITFLQY